MNRVCVLLCLFPVLLWAGEPKISVPAADQILSTLRPNHPRLLLSSNDFPVLAREVNNSSELTQVYKRLREQAETILSLPPSKYEIPDGLRLLGTSRQVLSRVCTLACVYQISRDPRFARRAWTELEAAGNFKDWNPRHFLDTAEMSHAFAIGYDWLYEFWTPEQRLFLRTAMVEKGLKPALNCYQNKPQWWPSMEHNWNQVCNGGVGMAALAIGDEVPDLAGQFLNYAANSIQLPMRRFAPDGAWEEGPGYWDYATRYNVVFLAALESALGTDFGLSQIPGFDQTGYYPIYLSSPAEHSFNFADAGDHPPRAAQLFWFARRFDHPELAAFVDRQLMGAYGLIWFDPSLPNASISSLPLDRYFRTAEVATFRGDWTNPATTFVGFKAGNNAVNHSHLDLGSFVLDAEGERWATDLASDDYNLPGYFGRERWNYYRLRAEGHNTILLNPTSKPDQDPHANCRIIRFVSKPERAFAIADLSDAYGKGQKVQRGIALLERKNVLIQDEIHADIGSDFWWFMHSAAKIKTDGANATLTIGTHQLNARILSPTNATFAVMPAEPLPSSPHPVKQASNQVSKLSVHLHDIRDLRLSILLTPGSTNGAAAPAVIALSDW